MRAGSPLHFGVSSSVHGEERMMHMLYLLTGRPCLPRWDAALLQRDRWPRSHFEPSELSREQPSHFPSGAGLLVWPEVWLPPSWTLSPRAGSCFSSTWVLIGPVSADCPPKAPVLWALFKKQDICQPSRHAFLRFSLFWGSCLTFELPFLKEGNSAKMPDRSQNWTNFLYPPLPFFFFFFNILVESSVRKFSVRLVLLCLLV